MSVSVSSCESAALGRFNDLGGVGLLINAPALFTILFSGVIKAVALAGVFGGARGLSTVAEDIPLLEEVTALSS